MHDNTYNGWSNYATWRVNLEVFDGLDMGEFDCTQEAYELGSDLKGYAEELIFVGLDYDERRPSLCLMEDYARAFLQEVNYSEIAAHMIANYAEGAE